MLDMQCVYECELVKKKDLLNVLEANPFSEDSFAKIGYKMKEGASLGEDKNMVYVYFSCDDRILDKAASRLKGVATRCREDVEKRIIAAIDKEEESATAGFGDIFG